ncbi:hypothetical protein CTZ27_11250 [Streptomyces griseocarneus]|nr:hypothetical protein CTZ27_11250 [Streptomyces griseocarneus]
MAPRRPDDSTCVLTYDVASDPAPVQVSLGSTPKKATLFITVTNHRQSAVQVESVRFSFPVGSGPEDLSSNPGSADPQVDNDKFWRFELDEERPGSAVLTPKRSATLTGGEQLELELAHIEINAAVGTSRLTVDEQVKNEEPGTETWPLAKVPAGFTTGDFRPEYILVQSGTPAELTWRGDSRPGSATYTMLHDGEPCDVTNVRRWKSPPLHRDTAFALVVEVTESGNTAEYAMTTLVTVARPDLVVNDLTVNGSTTLTHAPAGFDLGEALELTYRAETDGFLVGYVRADQEVPESEDPPPTLTVTVGSDGARRVTGVQSRRTERAPGDPGSRLTAVVPKGATVTVARAGTTPSTHVLSWLPFGIGELKQAPAG